MLILVFFQNERNVIYGQLKGCSNNQKYVIQNLWSTTTGKHLNWIDGGSKKDRLTKEAFEQHARKLREERAKQYGMTLEQWDAAIGSGAVIQQPSGSNLNHNTQLI